LINYKFTLVCIFYVGMSVWLPKLSTKQYTLSLTLGCCVNRFGCS